jgi:2-keto-4-pentenoate hydratase/2-oxohepta-3-ene-1,7-dioic acid hydratase in catechol pathway
MRAFIGRARTNSKEAFGFFVEKGLKFIPIAEDFSDFIALVNSFASVHELIEEHGFNYWNDFEFLPPVNPSKIIAVGLNYLDHSKEFGQPVPDEPLIFLKPPSAIIGHLDSIIYPMEARRVDYEAELAVVVGKKIRNADINEARDGILGYTCANDVTERFFQKKDGQWTRAKGFDTFAPIGPWIAADIEPEDGLSIKSYLNGSIRQSSTTSEMIFSPAQILSFVSKVMTLNPGDVILTGTPSGVGELRPGDTVEIEIEGIGILKNPVVSE